MVTEEQDGIPDLDAIVIPQEEMGEGQGDGFQPGEVATVSAEFIGIDAFWVGFQAAHQLPGHLLGLQSLLQHVERPEARPASDAIYRICERSPSLHFLIRPGSAWVADAMAIGMYALPMAVAVRTEVLGKKAAKRAAKQQKHIPKPGSERGPQETEAPPVDMSNGVPADA